MPMMLSIQIAKVKILPIPSESHFIKFNAHQSYLLYGIIPWQLLNKVLRKVNNDDNVLQPCRPLIITMLVSMKKPGDAARWHSPATSALLWSMWLPLWSSSSWWLSTSLLALAVLPSVITTTMVGGSAPVCSGLHDVTLFTHTNSNLKTCTWSILYFFCFLDHTLCQSETIKFYIGCWF